MAQILLASGAEEEDVDLQCTAAVILGGWHP